MLLKGEQPLLVKKLVVYENFVALVGTCDLARDTSLDLGCCSELLREPDLFLEPWEFSR